MKNAFFLIISLFALALLSTLFSSQVSAQEVGVGIYVLNLGKFDISTGTFTADFYLDFKCSEDCSQVNFEFMNGRAASMDKIIDEKDEVFYRVQANLNNPVDLKRFPFDRQKMQIIIEDKTTTVEDLIYIPLQNESGLDNSIFFTGWHLDGWTAEVKEHEYPVYGETYSQYIFTINISKVLFNSFLKTILPVIFITLIVLSSFVLDPDKITTRLGMVGSALVASVMFHISIANSLPPLGYMTFADKFMILTYFILLASFVINIFMLEMLEQKKDTLVEKIHRRTEFSMFIIVPVLYALAFLLFL
ncbi:MAG: hypothetical protein V1743_00505 [Nanoarchaeota archaeon]